METAAFEKGATVSEKRMRQMQRNFEKLGDKIGSLGQKLTIGLTAPLAAFGHQAVTGFIEQEKAIADVEAALDSMGGASGKTAQELSKAADAMELNSLYDAEVILKQVTANLLTFGNVAGEQFDRAQQAAVDMSERLGQEPQQAAIMLGKALNDPVKGISALTRVGVQFTDQQKAQIEAMSKAGKTAEAQGIILEEVERQFKGAAAAAADATPWRKAQVAIGQAMDVVGEAILPIIAPVAEAIAGLARGFASLPEPVQKAAVVFGVMAAAIGPIMMALGPLIGMMAPFLAAIKGIAATQGIMVALQSGLVGIATAFGPILLAVGAIYLAWKNWDDIAPRLQPLLDQLHAIGEGLGIVEGKANRTAAEIAKDEPYRKFGETLVDISDWLQTTADNFDTYNARTAAAARENGTTIQAGFRQAWVGIEQFDANMRAWADGIKARFKTIATAMIQIGRDIVSGLVNGIRDGASRVGDALASVASSAVSRAKDFLGIKSPSRVFMEIGGFISEGMAIGIAGGTDKVRAATAKMTEAARQAALEVNAILRRLYPEMAKLEQYRRDAATLDSSTLSEDAKFDAGNRLRREHFGIAQQATPYELPEGFGESLATTGKINESIGKISEQLGLAADKTKAQTVKIAKSFADMAEQALGSLRGLVDGIKSGDFFSILDGVVGLFTQLGSMGAFGKGIQGNLNRSVPGYAGGTNFHPGGLAWVGERGKELVDLPRGSRVYSNSDSMAMAGGKLQVEVVANNNGFGAVVRNHAGQVVAEAAPTIAGAGAQMAGQRASFAQSRRVG